MMNDSYMPPQVYELTKSRGAAMSYMTIATHRETFLEPIRTKIVEDTKFRNHFERKAQYEKVTETLPPSCVMLSWAFHQPTFCLCIGAAR